MDHIDDQGMPADPDQGVSDGIRQELFGSSTCTYLSQLSFSQIRKSDPAKEKAHEVDKNPGQERNIVGRPEVGGNKAEEGHKISVVPGEGKHLKRVEHDTDVPLRDSSQKNIENNREHEKYGGLDRSAFIIRFYWAPDQCRSAQKGQDTEDDGIIRQHNECDDGDEGTAAGQFKPAL